MTALSAPLERIFQSGRDDARISVQVLASTTVYNGSAVMALAASHYARPIVASATAPQFYGFALEDVVNSSATQAAAKTCLIAQQGRLQVANTTGNFGTALVTGDIGKVIYMADDGNGFTLTSTNNVAIGKVDNIDLVNGVCTIAFQSFAMRSI